MKTEHVILIILDGWGHGKDPKASAIAQANTPFVDQLYANYPQSELITYGVDVGLPDGQMGNSEVGHLNIGAGRVVYQDLAKINKAIQEDTFSTNPVLQKAINYAKQNDKALHLMGLLSDGGVHSHIEHLKALCKICDQAGLSKVYIHAFMDGRDTDPKGGLNYIKDLQASIKDQSPQIATVIGRYYAMDRDKRWERVKLAYDLLVQGKGTACHSFEDAIQKNYEEGITDEFIMPLVGINKDGEAVAKIKEKDAVLFFNFRTDRPRELTQVLSQFDMPEFGMSKLDLAYFTMTRYDDTYKNVSVLYDKDNLKETLGEVLSKSGKTQVRIAETEKYPHVTFFFSGGREEEFSGEKRLLVSSPKVATYDLQPEMSANEITEKIIKNIKEEQPNFICLNYANTDMVGHTGVFDAAIKATEIVDKCLSQLIEVTLANNYHALIIADHGNSDFMINEDGSPNTAHTTNLVPCFYVSNNGKQFNLDNGRLADVAPTILHLLGITPPEAMTGNNLIYD